MNVDIIKPTISPATYIVRQSSLDSSFKNSLPRNFRSTNQPFPKKLKNVDITGLDSLNVSGSAQFTEGELKELIKTLSLPYFIVVDLREECHGFFNNDAISWLSSTGSNKDNKNISYIDILDKERRLLLQKSLVHNGIVATEYDLCNKYLLSYLRLPITDNNIPSTFIVDCFVDALKNNITTKTHVHFHCKAGRGRTSTLMIMYDILNNAKLVPFEDILKRQAMLGSNDYIKKMQQKNQYRIDVNDRITFLNSFYKYCVQNSPSFETSWSEWLKHNLYL